MARISRGQWGARAPKYRYSLPWSQVQATFVHYTAGPTTQTPRQIQNFHMDSKGWSDIAYSWLVNQAGDEIEARGWGVVGGHTENWNSKSHAICWIGGPDDVPSEAAKQAIRRLTQEANELAGRVLPVWPHKHVNSTSCPGPLTPWVVAGCPVSQEDDDMYDANARNEVVSRLDQILWLTRESIAPTVGAIAAAVGQGQVDAQEVARLVLAGLPADKIAEAISDEVASDVADELARRLAG